MILGYIAYATVLDRFAVVEVLDPPKLSEAQAQDIQNMSLEELRAALSASWQENAKLTVQLERAQHDRITKLLLKGPFLDRTADVIRSAKRSKNNNQVTVLMFDVDHFKRVNDTYGHAVGDQLLALLGDMVRNDVRQDDIVTAHNGENRSKTVQKRMLAGRYGGEEIMVIAKVCSHKEAMKIAKRLNNKIMRLYCVNDGKRIPVTASFGVFTYDPKICDYSFDDAIKFADMCLYDAKRGGRNRVIGKDASKNITDSYVHWRSSRPERFPVRMSPHVKHLNR